MPVPQQEKMIIYQMMTRLFGNVEAKNQVYGTRDENGVGKFNDITPAALRGIRELGATHVWYTGVLEHALLTDYTEYGIPPDHAQVVKGRAGSPYAIKDYYDVNPDLAVDVKQRLREFEALIDRTHAEGLKVIIDFVPNHVARVYQSDAKPTGVRDLGADDNTSVSFHPDNNFYYLPGERFQPPPHYQPLGNQPHPTKGTPFVEEPARVTGNDVFSATPSEHDWFETVKLNYGVDIRNNRTPHFEPVPATWNQMRDILLYWAQKKVDGFRCDMAEMVPHEFWGWVIPQVKQVNPDIVFIAEIYNPAQYRNYIQQGRFDFLYDKVQLYDTLRLLINQHSSTHHIAEIQASLRDIAPRMLHFLENHDEQRIASPFFAGDPFKAVSALVISATIDTGPMMIYFGQEVGEPGAGVAGFSSEDGRTTIYDYWGVPEHQKWMNKGAFDGALLSEEQKQLRLLYSQVLHIAKTNPAIVFGHYEDITRFNMEKGHFDGRLHAFVRSLGDERLIIVSSFHPTTRAVKVALSPEAAEALGLQPQTKYVGRDLLDSGADIGLDDTFAFETELPAFGARMFKIKN